MIDTKRYVQFLIDFDITPNQFMLLWFLINEDYPSIYKWCEEKEPWKRSEIDDLMEKGYINIDKYENKPLEALNADDFKVNASFKEELVAKNPDLMFEEFWESYPSFLFINAKRMPTKSTNKEEFEKEYIALIGKNPPLHKSIIRAVKWGQSQGYLNSGIVKFFGSRGWEDILAEMNNSLEVGEFPSDVQFD